MGQLENQVEREASKININNYELNKDKASLIKEIGRLRVELHEVQFLDHSIQRSEFLRKEISSLKLQIEKLKLTF